MSLRNSDLAETKSISYLKHQVYTYIYIYIYIYIILIMNINTQIHIKHVCLILNTNTNTYIYIYIYICIYIYIYMYHLHQRRTCWLVQQPATDFCKLDRRVWDHRCTGSNVRSSSQSQPPCRDGICSEANNDARRQQNHVEMGNWLQAHQAQPTHQEEVLVGSTSSESWWNRHGILWDFAAACGSSHQERHVWHARSAHANNDDPATWMGIAALEWRVIRITTTTLCSLLVELAISTILSLPRKIAWCSNNVINTTLRAPRRQCYLLQHHRSALLRPIFITKRRSLRYFDNFLIRFENNLALDLHHRD